MEETRIIELKESIFADNDREAEKLRAQLKEKGVFLINLMSVPEGHDKPLKYPLMFSICDVLLINKIDVLPSFDFDMDKVREYAKMRNPDIQIIPVCTRTGEGFGLWLDWIRESVSEWKA